MTALTFLITGGAGSLGKVLVKKLVQMDHIVRVLDINEGDLATMEYPRIKVRKIYGDTTDYANTLEAIHGADYVIHAAAMKNLEIAETNVDQLTRVNIMGTTSVARAAAACACKAAIFVSSDKAVLPSTAYGATKQMGEKIWRWRSRIHKQPVFSIIRPGNFLESRGNVFEVWRKQLAESRPLTITDIRMERYFIETEAVADLIIGMCSWAHQGDIIIPRMRKYTMDEMIHHVINNTEVKPEELDIIGARPGEKLVEQLLTGDEQVIYENEKYLVIK